MTEPVKPITISTLAGGAVDELFADALAKVCENIADPNTDHKAARVILLKFTVLADEDRRVGQIEIACANKLAGIKGMRVGVYFGRQDGIPVAVEAPSQVDLFPTPKSRPRVVQIAGEKGAQP